MKILKGVSEQFPILRNGLQTFTLSEKKSEEEIIREVLDYGIKHLIVTFEDKGVKIFYKEKDVIKTIYEPAINIEIKNKVGCGDVFGAVFFYSYISRGNKNIEKVLKLANIAAGYTASYKDMNEFKNLKDNVFSRYY
jgi:sugar/nucleoside kinase (ribokinase family)